MKNTLFSPLLFICFLAAGVLITSCKKADGDDSHAKLIQGKWQINSVRFKIYNGGNIYKDSLVHVNPQPENFVVFGSDNQLEYCFNESSACAGNYTLINDDSMYAKIGTIDYSWKILLLTETNFNVVSTVTDHNYPGATVEKYQGFIR